MPDLIPTNIITGFLGVGKTTAIKHLLRHKPEHEIWSVLVNEFGEIGIDGGLLTGEGVHVREVPGGCICCVGNLPMKVALNRLIAATRTHRLLIEPTGLGHPAEILDTLTGDYYRDVLDLRATLTLVDARKLSEPRYIRDATFSDQLRVADVLVANKSDLADPDDWARFDALEPDSDGPRQRRERVVQGALELEWLDEARAERVSRHPHHHRDNPLRPRPDMPNPAVAIPEGQNFVRRTNRGQGHHSCGWVFSPEVEFEFEPVFALLSGLPVPRAKAIMITGEGIFSFNMENGVLSVNELDETMDSRLELIDEQPIDAEPIEKQLLAMAEGA